MLYVQDAAPSLLRPHALGLSAKRLALLENVGLEGALSQGVSLPNVLGPSHESRKPRHAVPQLLGAPLLQVHIFMKVELAHLAVSAEHRQGSGVAQVPSLRRHVVAVAPLCVSAIHIEEIDEPLGASVDHLVTQAAVAEEVLSKSPKHGLLVSQEESRLLSPQRHQVGQGMRVGRRVVKVQTEGCQGHTSHQRG